MESYNLPYERVLYLDSDILCVGDASGLMRLDDGLLCCPDQSYFREQARDRRSYVPLDKSSPPSRADVFGVTFNAGMMAIRRSVLGPYVYEGLLERVRSETWSSVRTGHTDSVLLNSYFEGGWTQMPERYNYLISNRSAAYVKARTPMAEAVFLHFLGRPKPWQSYDAGSVDSGRRPAFAMWRAYASRILTTRV